MTYDILCMIVCPMLEGKPVCGPSNDPAEKLYSGAKALLKR